MTLRYRYLAILSFIGSLMLILYACAPSATSPVTTTTTPPPTSPPPTTPVNTSYTIAVSSKDGVGSFLVDANGMTLYWTTRDTVGQSNISGATLANWPAFYASNVVVPSTLNRSDFGTITRPEGGSQTTYKGYPLYYFIKDKNPMDTFGQGVAGVWSVVDPAASAPALVPVITILTPSSGATVSAGDLTVTIKVDNFNVVDKQGQVSVAGEGHVHFYLDVPAPTAAGKPAIPPSGVWAHVSGTTYTFSNVAPGTHTITVQLVNNDHTPLLPLVTAQITVTVTAPVLVPSLTITSPSDGATLPAGSVTVTAQVNNFNVVDKQGQANVAGEGHLHFYLDVPAPTTPGQPAIPPSGVWAHVSGTTYTFTNVAAGTHTITVQLVNNDHTPLIPVVTAQITITVTAPAVAPPPPANNPPPVYHY